MGFRHVLLLFLASLSAIFPQDYAKITVIVDLSDTVAQTDDNFVCATIDWWPPEKCNYNDCPWGMTSVLNLDLNHPYLSKAIQAFNPLRIRVGGTLQNRVIYDVGSSKASCSPFMVTSFGLFGFSTGCLCMERWDAVNSLFLKTGAIVTFGLNALNGRHSVRHGCWQGSWNSSNAHDFINYTITKGYPIDSWEFGNELSGHGVGAHVNAQQYGRDLIELKTMLRELYSSSNVKPFLVAPGGFFDDPQWYAQLLEVSGPDVLDALSHHVYNLGGGDDPRIASKITNPTYLGRFADIFRNVQLTIERHGPWSSAWVGEAGGVFNSGSPLVSNTFLNSIWYLDQLGMASKYNTKVYCRQTLIGGNYGLLDTHTFIPNPDYYSALLWHQLMGKGVLSVNISETTYLRGYAHCSKAKSGITLLLINLCKSATMSVTLRNDPNVDRPRDIRKSSFFSRGRKRAVSWFGRKASGGSQKREEYHLTAKDGRHLSRTMLLNGNPLQLTATGDIPDLRPMLVAANAPISITPLSIAFVTFPFLEARACSSKQ